MTNFSISQSFFLLILFAILVIPPVSSLTLSPGNSFASAPTIANGDPVYIHGIATGQPSAGLQVWLISKNYVKLDIVQVNADDTYEYELKSADTQLLAPGQYFVLVQHPMENGVFDIYYDSTSGKVFNRQLGTGTSIFQLTGAGGLQNTDGANALMLAINNQNIDDTFATTSFIIGNPTAIINPIGNHAVGDKFTINGSTNLAVGNNLNIEITSSSFNPTQKVQSGEFSAAAGTVNVEQGTNGFNHWSFNVDASTFKPDEYIVRVSGVTIDVSGSSTFNIIEKSIVAPASTTVTPTFSVPASTEPSLIPPTKPATTKSPAPLAGLIGILCIMIIARQTGK